MKQWRKNYPKFQTQPLKAQNESQSQIPDKNRLPALQKTDSVAQIAEAIFMETGNSEMIRMFCSVSSHEASRGPDSAASQSVEPVDDSIALGARRHGFENHEDNAVSSLPNNSLVGLSTPFSSFAENLIELDLNLTVEVGELGTSQ